MIYSLILGVIVTAFSASPVDMLQAAYSKRWGEISNGKFVAWRDFLQNGTAGSELDRLKKTNEFFNRNIVFGEDAVVWGQPDYWATPLETLGRVAGDCEDFVIAKYFTLQLLGVSADKLRLVYVRARTGASDTTSGQAHMVLAYYPSPDAEPLVLDNLISEIRPAGRRPDLQPVFSFNGKGIFSGATNTEVAPAIGSGRLSRWEDLLKRAHAEGFE